MGGSEGGDVDVLGAIGVGGGTSKGTGAEVIFLVHFPSSFLKPNLVRVPMM